MLKIFVGSSTAYHPHWGEGGKGANSIPQTTQLNFRKRFIYVRSTKISLFTSLSWSKKFWRTGLFKDFENSLECVIGTCLTKQHELGKKI